MELYAKSNQYKLFCGSMLDMKEYIANDSIDAVVCDPPYELHKETGEVVTVPKSKPFSLFDIFDDLEENT